MSKTISEIKAAKNLAEGMKGTVSDYEVASIVSGWGYIETRRPCKGYPKRPFWRRIRSNPMRRNYH